MGYYEYFIDKVDTYLEEEMLDVIRVLEENFEEAQSIISYYKRVTEDFLERIEDLQRGEIYEEK